MNYKKYVFKPLNTAYLKKKSAAPDRWQLKTGLSVIGLGFSCYHLIWIYKEWIYSWDYWKNRRLDLKKRKAAYEFIL